MLMRDIASGSVLDQAFSWLMEQRKDHSPNSDVWQVRQQWERIKPQLQEQLLAGDYTLSPVRPYWPEGEPLTVWQSIDAVVLKAIAIVLTETFKPLISSCCYHARGHGGLKVAVRAVHEGCKKQTFFVRSDVKSYYASIDHHRLYDQVCERVDDKRVQRLIWAYLRYMTDDGGNCWENKRGICRGSPLSPLMGALYLAPLDEAMKKLPVKYFRYMDDCVPRARRRLQTAIL